MTIDLYCQRCIDYVDVLPGVPPLGVYNHNTVGENGGFQPIHPKIYRNSQTVSNAATVTISHQWEICCRFLRRVLHTSTAVARLPLRQLGFLVTVSLLRTSVTSPARDHLTSHQQTCGSAK